jgi:hypothetical protein
MRRRGITALLSIWMAVVLWPSCALAGEWLFDFGAGVPYNWGPEHQVAMNASGEAALIFGFNGVRVSLRPSGGYFESPEWGGVLVSAGGIEGTTPDVGIDNRGDVVAVWEQYTDRHSIYEATKPAGGSFGAPVEVSSESEEASSPNVAIDDAGEATVAWLDHSGSAVVRAASATLGQPFSTPVGLSGEPGDVSDPRVTVNDGGDTIVSWERGDSQLEVMVRRAGTSWPANGAHDYGTALGEVAASSMPSVTIDSAGEALAVWAAPGGTSYAARVAPHMVLFGPVTALTGVDGSPSVAMNEAGEAAIAWPSGRSVQVATAPPAGTFGTPEQLSSYFAPSTTHVSIGAGGNIAVEWEAMNERDSYGREGSFRTPAGTFAKPQGLYGGDLPEEGSLVVATDSAGDMIGVWDTTDLHDMVSMLYDAGPQLGTISAAATGGVGQSLTFSIPTPASTWKPLQTVTWNFGDDTTANGLSVSHVYSAPGTYQITATASDTQHTGFPTPFFPEYVSNSESQTVTVSSAPTPATTTPSATPAASGSVSLTSTHITTTSSGEAAVKLSCKGTGTCRGKRTLTVRTQGMFEKRGRSGKGGQRRSKTTTIGTASFSIAAGKTVTLELKLNPAGRALLSAGHGRLNATLTILKSSPAPSQTHTANVRLVQQKVIKGKK